MAITLPGPITYELGRSNSGPREFFGDMPLDIGQINPDYLVYFDDFTYLHGKLFNAAEMYDVVKDAAATVTTLDVINGVARISSTAVTDVDGGLIQFTSNPIARVAGKKLWFEARVKVSDIDHEMFIGIAEQAATNPEAVIAAGIHRLGLEVTSASGTGLRFANGDGTTVDYTSTGVAMVAATYITVGFYYNGSTIDVYVDRIKKLSGIVPRPASATDLMGVALYNLSGNATSTHTLDIDYYMVIAER